MKFKRIGGIISLGVGMIVLLIAGNHPLEGPVGLSIGLVFGCFLSVLGGVLIGKSVLERWD